MAEGNWEEVTVLRKRQPKASQLRSQQAINQAMRQGVPVETTKKFEGGQNKQHAPSRNTSKLDAETEELRHEHIGLDVGRLIQQGRQQKSMTQKDLATKICEKPQIIADYETGKAIPNQQVLGKLERALGMKLRGKDKGLPL